MNSHSLITSDPKDSFVFPSNSVGNGMLLVGVAIARRMNELSRMVRTTTCAKSRVGADLNMLLPVCAHIERLEVAVRLDDSLIGEVTFLIAQTPFLTCRCVTVEYVGDDLIQWEIAFLAEFHVLHIPGVLSVHGILVVAPTNVPDMEVFYVHRSERSFVGGIKIVALAVHDSHPAVIIDERLQFELFHIRTLVFPLAKIAGKHFY